MHDQRIQRGNTYAAMIIPAGSYPDTFSYKQSPRGPSPRTNGPSPRTTGKENNFRRTAPAPFRASSMLVSKIIPLSFQTFLIIGKKETSINASLSK